MIQPGRPDPAGIQRLRWVTSACTDQEPGATEPLRLGPAALPPWPSMGDRVPVSSRTTAAWSPKGTLRRIGAPETTQGKGES
ncbi:unnamed protein product [Ixodes pacificus]